MPRCQIAKCRYLLVIGTFIALVLSSVHFTYAQMPSIEWQNTIGGSSVDFPVSVIPTADGGYMVAGHSSSGMSGDKSMANVGGDDIWMVKLDATGTIVWEKTIGGDDQERLGAFVQTTDGGYIFGSTSSSGISGDKTEANIGSDDFWIIKTDSVGNIEWENTIGGTDSDELKDIIQTNDGGYLAAGSSSSGISGDKTEANLGNDDFWIVKLDSQGSIEWQNTIGGSDYDDLAAAVQTMDGGYFLGGSSNSGISGDKTEASRGTIDFWVVKTDSLGTVDWDKTVGGNHLDRVSDALQSTDGGYMMVGDSHSDISGDKTDNSFGSNDYWIVRLGTIGNIQFQRTYGGSGNEAATCIIRTDDGGYLVGGHSTSGISGTKTTVSNGQYDHWLLKLDFIGLIEWQKAIGGSNHDFHRNIEEVDSNQYVFASNSISDISGDKDESSQGNFDYWVVKLGPDNILLPLEWGAITATPLNKQVQVTWTTFHEQGIENFEIQRSTDGANFYSIGSVEAANSITGAEYTFLDHKPMATNYYRIKEIALSGGNLYSPVAKAFLQERGKLSIYPNPASGQFWISCSSCDDPQSITIIDTRGQLVFSKLITPSEKIDVSFLPSGTYAIRINGQNNSYHLLVVN